MNIRSLVSLALMSFLIQSCYPNRENAITIPSTGNLSVSAKINTEKSKPDYGIVIFHIYDRFGNGLYSINSHASDFSKWAVGWTYKGDTLVMYSSDIGSYAWKIDRDFHQKVELSREMHSIAKGLYEKKYDKKSY